MKKFVIGYFADGPWSHGTIKKLLSDKSIKIAFICARADNPDGVLREIAIENGIDFLCHPRVNSVEFQEIIKIYSSDLFVSMSYNQIFKKSILSLPKKGVINCHAGKLPFYRGRNVLNWALINGENEFGITTHFVDEGIDTGDIILQRSFSIQEEDDYATLLAKAYAECPRILYDSIKLVQENSYVGLRQSDIDPVGFYCVRRVDGDEIINWNQEARDVFNFIRALCHPGPRAKTFLKGEALWINKAQIVAGAKEFKGIPGSILSIEAESFLVKTKDSLVRICEWSNSYLPRIGDRFL